MTLPIFVALCKAEAKIFFPMREVTNLEYGPCPGGNYARIDKKIVETTLKSLQVHWISKKI